MRKVIQVSNSVAPDCGNVSMDNNCSPLSGKWKHGNGVLVCGCVRVASADFDSNPSEEVKKEIFDWICRALNDAQVKKA